MKWEYQAILLHDRDKLNKGLNRLGEEEWELVTIFVMFNDNIFIFKRPKPELPKEDNEALKGYFGGKVG